MKMGMELVTSEKVKGGFGLEFSGNFAADWMNLERLRDLRGGNSRW